MCQIKCGAQGKLSAKSVQKSVQNQSKAVTRLKRDVPAQDRRARPPCSRSPSWPQPRTQHSRPQGFAAESSQARALDVWCAIGEQVRMWVMVERYTTGTLVVLVVRCLAAGQEAAWCVTRQGSTRKRNQTTHERAHAGAFGRVWTRADARQRVCAASSMSACMYIPFRAISGRRRARRRGFHTRTPRGPLLQRCGG